jgi:hypothetical protein
MFDNSFDFQLDPSDLNESELQELSFIEQDCNTALLDFASSSSSQPLNAVGNGVLSPTFDGFAVLDDDSQLDFQIHQDNGNQDNIDHMAAEALSLDANNPAVVPSSSLENYSSSSITTHNGIKRVPATSLGTGSKFGQQRYAGRDSTNIPAAKVSKPAKAKATRRRKSPSSSSSGAKAGVKASVGQPKKNATKRKRSKMPEAEQKRRNCESAKRSRLKKMAALAEAQARVANLEEENKVWRGKFEKMREWSIKMAIHFASHHKNCSCTSKASQTELENILASPPLH